MKWSDDTVVVDQLSSACDAVYIPAVKGLGLCWLFSNQNLSPNLRFAYCRASRHVNVGPSIDPREAVSDIPAGHRSMSSTVLYSNYVLRILITVMTKIKIYVPRLSHRTSIVIYSRETEYPRWYMIMTFGDLSDCLSISAT